MKKIIIILTLVLGLVALGFTVNKSTNYSADITDLNLNDDAGAFTQSEMTTHFGLSTNAKISKISSGGMTYRHSSYNPITMFLRDNGVVYLSGALSKIGKANSSVPVRLEDNSASGFINGTVVDIAAGENHFLLVDSKGILYAFGKNDKSQLGNGTTTAQNLPIKVSDGNETENKFVNDGSDKIVKVEAGEHFSLILTESGMLYYFGKLVETNNGNAILSAATPKQMPNNDNAGEDFANGNVTDISLKYNHALLIANNGIVYSLGNNQAWGNWSGKLGLAKGGNSNGGSNSDQAHYFVAVPTKVWSTVETHTENSSSGNGSKGGYGDEAFSNNGVDPVVSISAGLNHSLILTASGNAYAFGVDDDDRLGVNSPANDQEDAKKVRTLNGISSITASAHASLFVVGGKIYITGKNFNNSLDESNNGGTINLQELSYSGFDNSNVKSIESIGARINVNNPTYVQTTYIIKEDGTAFSMGYNNLGQQGNGATASNSTITQIGTAGAHFSLTGTTEKSDNTERTEMKYSTNVTLENISLSGSGSSSPSIIIDGTDVTTTYKNNGNKYETPLLEGEEKRVEIKVKYNTQSIITYKVVVDRKAPELSEKALEGEEPICNVASEVYYCSGEVTFLLHDEILTGYISATKTYNGNVEDIMLTDEFNAKTITFTSEEADETLPIRYEIIDGVGNKFVIMIVLDNIPPRVG